MSAARLIVCEKVPRWAVALRRALGDRSRQIVETRSLISSLSALAESPASLVVAQITSVNIEPALVWLSTIHRDFPLARVVVALEPDLASAEPLLREAGAVAVYYSTLQAKPMARLARRQLALAPSDERDLWQWIAERMPWPTHASA